MESPRIIRGSVHRLPFISGGVSSVVYQFSESAVIKASHGMDGSQEQLAVERAIYERLGSHPRIPKLLCIHDGMIVIERLQYPVRKRLWDLRDAGQVAPPQDVLRWALHAAEGLRYLHSRGVFQVDIGAHNMLLDWDEGVKLSDFAGSSIDGSEPGVAPSSHSEHPHMPASKPSVQSEIFALGSAFYEMETTRQPYHDKTDKELETLFAAGKFPDTSTLILGDVIRKCWTIEYKDVGEVLDDIKRIDKGLKGNSAHVINEKWQSAWWNTSYRILPLGIVFVAVLLVQQKWWSHI